MRKTVHKLTSLAIAAALVLSGCAESKAPASGETTPVETTTSTAAVQTEETTTTTTSAEKKTETTEISTTAAESEADTTQPRVPDERLSLSLEADQSGSGMEFARVYKLKNTSEEAIEDMHDKLLDFEEFDEAQQLVLVYDNNDTVVVEWNNGNPEWKNATRYFNSGSEFDDNILSAGEELSITVYNFGDDAAYFTVSGTDPEETTTSTTAITTMTTTTTTKSNAIVDAINDETLPNPVMDERIFTLYIGGGETCDKYDVQVDALPADILGTAVKELQKNDVTIAVDKVGKYSIVARDEVETLSILAEAERMLSREAFEELKQYFTDPEYADMTYEEYRSFILESLEAAYPGLSEKFDENGHLKETDSNAEYISISYNENYGDITPYCDSETVIKEGLRAAFADLENNKDRKALLENGETVYFTISLRYYGGYVVSYDADNYTLSGGHVSASGNVYLGKAKAYEKDPSMLTRQVFSPKSEALKEINTADSPYELTIEILSEGYIADAISVKRSGYANVMSNEAILGEIPEITFYGHGDFSEDAIKEVWVEFRIKEGYRDNVLGTYTAEEPQLEGIGRFNIFMYFTDGNMTLPIQTYYDKDTYTVYTVTNAVGTYCLFDLEMWLDNLGIEP